MARKTKSTNWRLLLTYVTLVGFLILIFAIRKQIFSTIDTIHTVDFWALALIVPIEALNYHAQAKLYQESMEILGTKLSYKFLYRFSLELNFFTTIFPSGGISAFTYMNVRLKNKKISAAQSTLIQLTKFAMVFASFQILLIVGLLLLAIGGHANELMVLIAGALMMLLVVLTGATIFVIGSESRINTVFTYITRLINSVIKLIRPSVTEGIKIDTVKRVFKELHQNYLLLRGNLKALKWPFIWGMIANITEIAAVYIVYVAFGHWENPGGIIMAYAVANFAGIVSILPAGIGVYETLMTVILAAAGISPSLSIPVTIMYRVVNTSIQVIPGYALYQRALRRGEIASG
ncbi:MAG TPA: lysylphosphatidylglycerol synthase transmembrane domain-containing protein [Candidatus Saccharimonadales bacterium]|nr:lysylphosphatidylglycerol synthase transmembrane domain-containing protein [Candidatus Saccharimonadales bacterium]